MTKSEMTLGNLIQRCEARKLAIAKLFGGAPPSIDVYEHGVIHTADKQSNTLRWDAIKQMRVEKAALAAQRSDGSTFAFENDFGDAFEAIVPAILEQAGRVLAQPHIAQLQAGEAISYGRFTIDPQAGLLHLPFGDAIALHGLDIRVPLIEQRFIIFDEQAAAAFDSVAEKAQDAAEDDPLFSRPKWFRPYPFSDLQPYPRFFAVLVHLGVAVRMVGARLDRNGDTISYTHEWSA